MRQDSHPRTLPKAPPPASQQPAPRQQNPDHGLLRQALLLTTTLGLILSVMSPLHAAEVEPFPGRSLNPLTQIYGLPNATTPSVLAPGQISFGLDQNIANSFSIQRQAAESLVIDGELWRTELSLGVGLPNGWRLDLELPYLHHGKGVLDGPISSWHDIFSLPNGGREKRPKNALLYQYSDAGQVLLQMDETRQGLGDIQLRAGRNWPWAQRDIFLGLGVKLPTGEAKRLTGSGATDLSASLLIRDSHSLAAYRLSWFGGAGFAHLGETDIGLAERQRRWAWTSHIGGGWQALPDLQLVAQLDHHSALYHSRLRALGHPALQFTVGLQWQFTHRLRLDVAFSEDLITTASPDFRLLAAIRQGF